MSLMSRLLISIAVVTLAANAAFDMKKFIRANLVQNPQVTISKIETIVVKDVPENSDWKAHLILMHLSFKGKSVKAPETIFVNEKAGLVTLDLFQAKNGANLKRMLKPGVPASFYNDAHLIAGNKNAKHKLVIFSDPQCPYCMDFVPSVVKDVKAHPDKLALYYYHLPLLRIHPAAGVLVRVMEVLQKAGKKDDAMRIYDLKINPKERDEAKILAEVKKQLGIEVSKEAISKPEIHKAIEQDMESANRMMIQGTPAIFFDSKFDFMRFKYKDAIK